MTRSSLEQEILALAGLPRDELNRRWRKVFACAAPKGVQRGLLELGLAWRMQAREFGGLSPATKRQLQRLADQRRDLKRGDEQNRPTGDTTIGVQEGEGVAGKRGRTGDGVVPSPAACLAPGTRLVREWHGRTHHVEIIEDGFVFEGETYASLSAIARQITGARWSGPRFFGLGVSARREAIRLAAPGS